jgi:hypothetical protein
LIYFHGIVPGLYVAEWPVYIVGDDPSRLTFTVSVDDRRFANLGTVEEPVSEETDIRRRYATRQFQQRLHQREFRERVLRAYQHHCAVCRLRRDELLDAAHTAGGAIRVVPAPGRLTLRQHAGLRSPGRKAQPGSGTSCLKGEITNMDNLHLIALSASVAAIILGGSYFNYLEKRRRLELLHAAAFGSHGKGMPLPWCCPSIRWPPSGPGPICPVSYIHCPNPRFPLFIGIIIGAFGLRSMIAFSLVRESTRLTPTRHVEVRQRFLREHPGHTLDGWPLPAD